MPVGVGEIDRVGKEGRFIERDVQLEPHASREARFGKQQIAAACPADCKVSVFRANRRERICDCSVCIRRFIRRKAWRLSVRSVDHMAAEEHEGGLSA